MRQARTRRIPASTVLFLYAFLVVALTSPRVLTAQNSEANRLAQSAAQKYQSGDLEGAIATYHQATVLQPNDPNILFALAQALGDQGATQEVTTDYQKTLQLYDQLQARGSGSGLNYKPNMAVVWNNLAVLYCRDKHLETNRRKPLPKPNAFAVRLNERRRQQPSEGRPFTLLPAARIV